LNLSQSGERPLPDEAPTHSVKIGLTEFVAGSDRGCLARALEL
jgi:hypothetical protein